MRQSINRTTLSEAPYRLWNAFVDLLTGASYDDLLPAQRPAYLVFWYDSEVQNGGHLQYFQNHGIGMVDETLAALDALSATQHRDVLRRARDSYASAPAESAEEYVALAIEGALDDFDSEFHQAVPDLHTLLQRHFSENTDTFVQIVEDR